MGESPKRNNLYPARPRQNVGPPEFYGESLSIIVLGEQATVTADNPFTLSEVTASDNTSENEREQ